LEDLVLAVEGGVSVNKDSEFDLENITTDAELQERKCLTILPQVQLFISLWNPFCPLSLLGYHGVHGFCCPHM
jgi:hypothetical protein